MSTPLFNALSALNEDEKKNSGRKPIAKSKLIRNIMDATSDLTKKSYNGDDWEPVKSVLKKIEAVADLEVFGSVYDQTNDPPTFREWKFVVNYSDPKEPDKNETIFGIVTAHGIGGEKKPLEKYDITVVLY